VAERLVVTAGIERHCFAKQRNSKGGFRLRLRRAAVKTGARRAALERLRAGRAGNGGVSPP
jgi:hypothetical protein